MVNLLIPYTPLADHPDPLLDEFTYGDVNERGKKLLKDVEKGDYIFLHTSQRGKRVITAYYVVAEVHPVSEAYNDINIRNKYRNPHLTRYQEHGNQYDDDVIVFGDPIRSKKLEPSLPLDRQLTEKLYLNIPFHKNKTELQNISSATRAWRELSDSEVNILLKQIDLYENQALSSDIILSTDEVLEIRENDLENAIVSNPQLLGENVRLVGRQIVLPSGRTDLLFESDEEIIVVELKLNEIGKNAVNQIRAYIRDLRNEYKKKNVRGIILCKDILPTFMEEFKQLKNIEIYLYGWKLHVYPLETE